MVPIPYPVVDFAAMIKTIRRLFGSPAKGNGDAFVYDTCARRRARQPQGVKSGTVESICEPIGHADQVRAEGSHVIRHLDRFI